jgi:hypothetical protein
VIHYLVTEAHPYTMTPWLRRLGAPVAPIVRIVTYEQTRRFLRGGPLHQPRPRRSLRRLLLDAWRDARREVRPIEALPPPPTGHWIFSDVDRLTATQREEAARFRDLLRVSGAATSIHNDPLATMGRYELLRTLRERGRNDFDVYRLTESRRPSRYPVFLRTDAEHSGAETPLLDDAAAFDAALAELDRTGRTREGRLAVEFHAERDERGLYRKYSVWCVGGRIVPGHLFFGPQWMLKEPVVVDVESLRIEGRFFDENPHAEALADAFRIGRIDYGRADYGVVGGRVQIYEINSNPGIPSRPSPGPGLLRAAFDERGNELLLAAFRALNDGPARPHPS